MIIAPQIRSFNGHESRYQFHTLVGNSDSYSRYDGKSFERLKAYRCRIRIETKEQENEMKQSMMSKIREDLPSGSHSLETIPDISLFPIYTGNQV